MSFFPVTSMKIPGTLFQKGEMGKSRFQMLGKWQGGRKLSSIPTTVYCFQESVKYCVYISTHEQTSIFFNNNPKVWVSLVPVLPAGHLNAEISAGVRFILRSQ